MPVFGSILDDFVRWLHVECGYTRATTSVYLNGVSGVVRWLRRRRIDSLSGMTLRDLQVAHCCFLGRNPTARNAARTLELFLRAKGTVAEGALPMPSSTEKELARFAAYLCETRGLSRVTIRGHRQRVGAFLKFLRFEHNPARLNQLRSRDIDGFLRQAARTNNRFTA